MSRSTSRTRVRLLAAALLAVGSFAAAACAPEAPTNPTPTTAPPCGTYTGATPTASLEVASSTVGGTLHLTGTGWLHPTNGGSTIAIKLDEGAFSHLAGQGVHPNLTVWQLVEVPCTGILDATIQLPTAANSTPTFGTGAHSLRLLTGSIKAGDAVRTVGPINFTVS